MQDVARLGGPSFFVAMNATWASPRRHR